jgi:Histidine kinase-, DNA gyrase B-, and HSP90-like ATPase
MTSINIRPGVNVLSVLRHLNYKPWFALAEFVDNSLQSFLRHRDEMEHVEREKPTLRVSIVMDPVDNRITIRDNAGGIHKAEFPRAFRAAELPPDRNGLSEFGMGMKSAACWFAPRWSARTSALGESVERMVSFDIHSIVRDALEELDVQEIDAPANVHYTEIVLSDIYKIPAGRTIGKIKDHLTDIYRIFIRQGILELRVNGDLLKYFPPEILQVPHYKTPEGEPIRWLKDFRIELPEGREVYGFAAIRKVGSTSDAGFALFRRNRLIQGSADEGYRPEEIFGKSNSFVYQRLFGELHLKGFGVSHTKDGIQWDGFEEQLLARLRETLDEEPLPLLKQAREYRFTPKREELTRAAAVAVERTAVAIERDVPSVMAELEYTPPPEAAPEVFTTSEPPLASRQIEVEHGTMRWRITLETSNDPAVGDWVEIFDRSSDQIGTQNIGVRLSLAHPFTQRYSTADPDEIELLLRIAAALVLAESIARISGAKQVGLVRKVFNHLLRDALAR